MSRITRVLTIAVVTALFALLAVPAFAHVTVRADTTEAGGFAKYTVRVPNESEEAATTSIEVQLPPGYEEARYQPLEGWDISVSDGVLLIEGGRIEPGEFQEFAFSARNPEEPGDITFPAIQTYEDGEVARWVGAPDTDQPAPVVTIEPGSAGGDSHGGDDAGAEATAEATAAAEVTAPAEPETEDASEPAVTDIEGDEVAAAPGSDDGDGGSNALSILALVAGLLGLGLGGAAFARTRSALRA